MAGLTEIQDFYRQNAHFEIEVCDLRPERAEKTNGVIVGHCRLSGDPAGYVKVSGKSMRECRRAFVEIFRKLTRASKGAMRVEVRRGIGEVEM